MELTEVVVSQMITASAEDIFDLWMDTNNPGSPWFGSEKTVLNPVVEGLFYFAVRHEGRTWAHYGRFLALDRPNRIEYTWMSEATRGAESTVSLTLVQRGGQTEVTLRHSGVPDDEMGRRHKDGWQWMLSTLAERFGSKPTASATESS